MDHDQDRCSDPDPGSSRGSEGLCPWIDPGACFDRLRDRLNVDHAVLGILDPSAPACDGFLVCAGVDPGTVSRWCDDGAKADPSLRAARRSGIRATTPEPGRAGPPLPPGCEALVLVLIATVRRDRAWYLALGRAQAWTERDRQAAALGLRRIACTFDAPGEAGVGRVLLGAGDRPLHADAGLLESLVDQPQALTLRARALRRVTDQRWPEPDAAFHDLNLDWGAGPAWVRFRDTPSQGPLGGGRYLELRPIQRDDAPAVGAVDDPRIARALAYLTDRHAQSPALNELAEVIGCSPFHFHRLFTKQAGISPKQFLLRHQLQVAKWLLRTDRLPIQRIAAVTGFTSHGHFTATFTRVVGASPSTYREDGEPVEAES